MNECYMDDTCRTITMNEPCGMNEINEIRIWRNVYLPLFNDTGSTCHCNVNEQMTYNCFVQMNIINT